MSGLRAPDRGAVLTSRVLAGLALIVAGIILTWILWMAGWYWGYLVVLIPIGVGVALAGLGDHRRARSAQQEWRYARAERERLVDGVIDADARGVRPVDWLHAQGIHAPRVRRYVLDHARRKARTGG